MEYRCDITGNQCGSDTWGVDYECKCKSCQKWILEWKDGEGRWAVDDYMDSDWE